MLTKDFSDYLDRSLQVHLYASVDGAFNGLQIGDLKADITKVAFAVDACLQSFERAIDQGAQCLVVHHGLYWGKYEPLVGHVYDRIKFLTSHNLALYASHLPLDAHLELGNNAGLAKKLGMTDLAPFGRVKNVAIGVKGRLPRPLSIEEVSQKLFGDERGTLGRLPFGKDLIETIGFVSGGATHQVEQAINEGLDLYVTGEPGHVIYHKALESGINVLFGGHYNTETWGVSQLMKQVKNDCGLETFFIDLPTGL